MNRDHEAIKELLFAFLNRKSSKEKIMFIFQFKRNDWEKWFQIEFAHFIQQKYEVKVEREVSAYTSEPDGSSSKFYVDILFREKGTRKDSYIFIEIKCNYKTTSLIRGVRRDKNKLSRITKCDFKRRSLWCIGFHRNCGEKNIEEINDFIEKEEGVEHRVIKLCNCSDKQACKCNYNQLGVLLVNCGAG